MDSRELRTLAERCSRLARSVGNEKVAQDLRTLAAEYLQRAALLAGVPATQQQQQIQPKKKEE